MNPSPMRMAVVFGLSIVPFTASGQPPAITQEGVRNAASQIPPSLPGGEIAPGSLVTLSGLRFGGGHAEVRIRAGRQDLAARVIAGNPERLEALVPPQMPPGDAELVVIRDGLASRPFAIRMVSSAFGIFTRNGSGWGPGEILNSTAGRETPNTVNSPAHPGGAATLLGTGLGTARSAEVLVGGRRASRILSRGPRRGRVGWEELRFELARDTPTGCYVPVVVKTGDHVSNAVTMAVARGEKCSEASAPDAIVLLAQLWMHLRLTVGNPVDFSEDVGAALFPADTSELHRVWQWLPPAGTCTAYTSRWPAVPSLDSMAGILFRSARAGRDAGAEITVAGPAGTVRLGPHARGPGIYSAVLGGGPSVMHGTRPLFLRPGRYRISGSGGRDVGAFTVDLQAGPSLEWLNPESAGTVDRARGLAVEWRGATKQQQVILAAVNIDQLSGAGGIGLCAAPGEAGRWNIDPLWLAHLPVSRNLPGVPLNYLFMATLPAPDAPRFHTRGAANGMALFTAVRGRSVNYR